jgi:hypothetical protein
VLTSRHHAYPASRGYYVSFARWQRTYATVRRHEADADVLVLPYAQLITDLPAVQTRLQHFVGWPVLKPFDQYHDQPTPRDGMTEGALGGLRPPDPTRLEGWRDPIHAARLQRAAQALPELEQAADHLLRPGIGREG